MSAVLTVASQIRCGHSGTLKIIPPGSAKLKVNGVAVLLAADLTSAPIACPAGQGKCSSVVVALEGTDPPSKLQVGGRPVLRDSLSGTTSGVPPKLEAVAGQSKLVTR